MLSVKVVVLPCHLIRHFEHSTGNTIGKKNNAFFSFNPFSQNRKNVFFRKVLFLQKAEKTVQQHE